jgi:mono/diheme cytochrome c family protein
MAALAVAMPAFSAETNAQKRPLPPPLPPMPPQRKLTRTPVSPPSNSAVVIPTVPAVSRPRPANPAPFTVRPGAGTATASSSVNPQATPIVAADPNALKWDAELKEHLIKSGESTVPFTFWLTNVSASDVFINNVRTSCGCTHATLPAQPWRIPPGSNGPIEVSMSVAGKSGIIQKGVTVDTSVGIKQLTVKATIPAGVSPNMVAGAMGDAERTKNMQLALADRQVVFKNEECAKCHAEPVKGKHDGRLIYAAACGICHDSHLRASAVPDLRSLPHPTDAEHWRKWITYGRAGSMMPAFAESEGGPLTEQQIGTLVDFVLKAFPSRPQPAVAQPRAAAPTTPATEVFSAFPPQPQK